MTCARYFLRLYIVLLAATAWTSHAAPLERDAGGGLAYYRVHELPADLPPQPTGRATPCVVDLRYARADAAGAAAFVGWLKFRATVKTPVFVLANRETASALLRPMADQPKSPGVVVVGISADDFHPDVAVKLRAENERRAYDALEKGTPLAKLVADNPDKVRNDEASLAKDRLAEAAAEEGGDILAGKREIPPIDVTLQRAIHLHRALVALKRI